MDSEHNPLPQDAVSVDHGSTPIGVAMSIYALARGLRMVLAFAAAAASVGLVCPPGTWAQEALVVRSLAEKRVAQLPTGPLFWRVETFPTLAAAQAASGPTGLVAESAGQIWLLTLSPRGGASPGGTRVAEVGPLPVVEATEYLLRINEAAGPPGSVTPVHIHPGSEAFYVLTGEQSIRTPTGTIRVAAGRPEAGPGGGTPLQVSSTGATDLLALVMFVVDAAQPFSSPAEFPAATQPATQPTAAPAQMPRALPRTGDAPLANHWTWVLGTGGALLASGLARLRTRRD